MSKTVTVNIPHELGRVEARRRIDAGFGQLASHMGAAVSILSQRWDGDRLGFSLQIMGQAISGVVEVAEASVKLELLLPDLLGLIASKLKGRLQTEGQLLLLKK
ncbi:MAG: polyhydroxyalkanoic acid system family protein [Phenylobacterium sp.]